MDAWDFYGSLASAVRPLRERGALAALCVIAGRAQGARETPPLSIREIAGLLDCSERQATRNVQALLARGLLESVLSAGGRVFMPSAQLLQTEHVFSDVAPRAAGRGDRIVRGDDKSVTPSPYIGTRPRRPARLQTLPNSHTPAHSAAASTPAAAAGAFNWRRESEIEHRFGRAHVGIVAKLRELQIAEDGADLWTIAAIYARFTPEHIAANVAHVLKSSRFINAGRVIAAIRENWAHYTPTANRAPAVAPTPAKAGGAAVDPPPASTPPDPKAAWIDAADPAQLRAAIQRAAQAMRPTPLRARVLAALNDPDTDAHTLRTLARTNGVRVLLVES